MTATDKMPKIWVTQEGKNDYSAAENQFGVIHFITKGDLRSFTGEQNSQVTADIRRFLVDYIPGHDYIIPSGNPMVAVLVAMSLGNGDHKFLKWDGRQACYIPFTLNSKMVK